MDHCVRCNPIVKNSTLCETCLEILANRLTVVLDEELTETEGYDSKFFVDLPKHYECPLCLGALRDPVQIAGECGHVFCEKCLNRATQRGPKTCPLDREPFIQTFPDRSKRREVLSLKVTCQNSGCSWKGELSDLLYHLGRNCQKVRINCLNDQCKEKILKEKIVAHCLECYFPPIIPCTFVEFGCTFEGSRSQIDKHIKNALNEHFSLTTAKINQQENKINQQENKIKQQENKINQQENEINQQENKINQQDNKINEQENEINQQENKINQQDNKINQQENKIKQQENKIKQQENKMNQQENKINEQENKIDHQENKIKTITHRYDQVVDINRGYENKIAEFEVKNINLQNENENLKKQYAQLEKSNNHLTKQNAELQTRFNIRSKKFEAKENTFPWSILNYEKHFKNAKKKNPEEIYSPVFYTSRGYKFQLSAYLNGHGICENTHTDLFFHLCKGDNDDTLVWPFNEMFTFTIVSQNLSVADKTYIFVPAKQGNDGKNSFIKPTKDKNPGRGLSIFLPHTKKEHYIKDDIMLIKCVVG